MKTWVRWVVAWLLGSVVTAFIEIAAAVEGYAIDKPAELMILIVVMVILFFVLPKKH